MVVDATITVNCSLPSLHEFGFENQIEIVGQGVLEGDPTNNGASFGWTAPVYADSDIVVDGVDVDCPPTAVVGATFSCTVSGDVTNAGPYGPVDVEGSLGLTGPSDCTLTPDSPPDRALGFVEAGETIPVARNFDVNCADRSLHEFTGEVSAAPTDIHVRDDASNNTGSDTDQVEVFQDADLRIADVHIECDEVVGAGPFTCIADVDFVNLGPASDVKVIVYAELTLSDECTAAPDRHLETATFALDPNDPQQVEFSWAVTCPPSDVLHPFKVTTDIAVDLEVDPHAVDEPDPGIDTHVVPTCVETINPHGQQIPQAPGTGQNEDGFYEIGSLPPSFEQEVWVRDNGTGTMFGPFPPGTKVKYIEANGAEPSVTPMGGNNGDGNGQAEAVDYQIRGQGDMEIVVFDEDGGEVSTLCLVPPFPK